MLKGHCTSWHELSANITGNTSFPRRQVKDVVSSSALLLVDHCRQAIVKTDGRGSRLLVRVRTGREKV